MMLMNIPRRQAPNARATVGGFLGLTSQKTMAGERNEERYTSQDQQTGEPTCDTEDHSFMQHRPGCPGTLPGWGKAKNAAEMYVFFCSFPLVLV